MEKKKEVVSRFDYVAYDLDAVKLQGRLKELFVFLAEEIEMNIQSPRARALVLTHLEESYMWVGKGIRDDQISRHNGDPQRERGDG